MSGGEPGRRLPFSKRALIVHATLALVTLGLWLIVPAATLSWRRGGGFRKLSYGLWAVIGICLLALGFSLGATSDEPSEATATDTAAPPVTVTVTESTRATVLETTAAAPPQPVDRPRRYVVRSVADGDTIVLANGYRVQLAQIDAPEINGECFGIQAHAALEALLPEGTRVRLEYDPVLGKLDEHQRRLAYVYKGGENINQTLVVRGAASVWFFNGVEGEHADRLDAAARAATGADRGLWKACAATSYDPLHALTAKKPAPPPPPPAPEPAPEPAPPPAPDSNCHPSYEGACLDPNASDYDCEGGSGNGPLYTGYVRVVGPDDYELDRDGNGEGCE